MKLSPTVPIKKKEEFTMEEEVGQHGSSQSELHVLSDKRTILRKEVYHMKHTMNL